jgi:hypothetical protein
LRVGALVVVVTRRRVVVVAGLGRRVVVVALTVVVGSGSVVVGGSVVVVVLAGTMEVTIEVTVIVRGSGSAPAPPAAAPATTRPLLRSGRRPRRVATTAAGLVGEGVAAGWRPPAGRRPLLGWLPPITAAGWDRLGGSVGHGLPPQPRRRAGRLHDANKGVKAD